ncbi:hypothetical protein DNTS_022073 [Danionella cerebrum]|uniref:Plasmolipin n=1 Tax=Danionella cerebrum TaxID=2873325 RepID=A0A553PYZ9_9TELE|nr:hypothetical protein DNTS_022073 [Danionella translucida]
MPGKVNTQTGSHQEPQRTSMVSLNVDMDFIKSIPGILLIAEFVCGLLVWPLIASTPYYLYPAYGWVMFVSVTLWILSFVLLIVLLLRFHQSLPSVPWPLVLLGFYAVAAVLYLTAFITNAASVPYIFRGNLGASAFFGIVMTLLYTASSFFAYVGWRGEGGNAAASTVPV